MVFKYAYLETIQKSEYDVILRQTVAVNDRTKAMVAITVYFANGTRKY